MIPFWVIPWLMFGFVAYTSWLAAKKLLVPMGDRSVLGNLASPCGLSTEAVPCIELMVRLHGVEGGQREADLLEESHPVSSIAKKVLVGTSRCHSMSPFGLLFGAAMGLGIEMRARSPEGFACDAGKSKASIPFSGPC